jgi:glycosyltransferase involved in cell wall biosynthesis
MRLHVLSLPHTQTTRSYDHCAFTAKVRKFCDMMSNRGHQVFLYASEVNEAAVTEHVPCIMQAEQEALFGSEWWWPDQPWGVDFNPSLPHWVLFNERAVGALLERLLPHDFVCLIMGQSQRAIIDALPGHRFCEFGVGYQGTCEDTFRAYESYAWMHACYATHQGGAAASDGQFFDQVIPNYYDPKEFPVNGKKPESYLLFMSRMTPRKGYQIAIDTARLTGRPLKIAGVGGDHPEDEHVEYVGLADTRRRGQLLSRAHAVLVPTIYVEPFGGVAAEALLCGTPVLTTDWGGFSEYVEDGVDGFRCRTQREFAEAAEKAGELDRKAIRERAQARFSYDAVAPQYERWFERLALLWDQGFYAGC